MEAPKNHANAQFPQIETMLHQMEFSFHANTAVAHAPTYPSEDLMCDWVDRLVARRVEATSHIRHAIRQTFDADIEAIELEYFAGPERSRIEIWKHHGFDVEQIAEDFRTAIAKIDPALAEIAPGMVFRLSVRVLAIAFDLNCFSPKELAEAVVTFYMHWDAIANELLKLAPSYDIHTIGYCHPFGARAEILCSVQDDRPTSIAELLANAPMSFERGKIVLSPPDFPGPVEEGIWVRAVTNRRDEAAKYLLGIATDCDAEIERIELSWRCRGKVLCLWGEG